MENLEGEPYWLRTARREIGQAEVPGAESNPRILEYDSVTTLKATDDLVPWCSSFLCWVMEQESITSPRSAAAIDWLKWGVKIYKPIWGCIVILKRPDPLNPNARHVGLYVGEGPGTIELLGGNQKNRVCIQPFPISLVEEYRMPDPRYYNFVPSEELAQ